MDRLRNLTEADRRGLLLCLGALAVFAALHAASWDSPGIYMDAVNPDYAVVRLLYGTRQAPIAIIPGNLLFGLFPVMPQLYHGSLPYYLGLPVYALLGTTLVGVRTAALWYALCVLVALGAFLRAARLPWAVVALALLVLGTDPAFILNWRTQFNITTLPLLLLLPALALMQDEASPRRALLAGFLAGCAVHAYFVFAGAVLLIGLLVLAQRRPWRVKLAWAAGAAGGMSLFLVGYALMLLRAGSLGAFAEMMRELVANQAPASSTLGPAGRIGHAMEMAWLALTPGGNGLMIFQRLLPLPFETPRLLLLVPAGLVLCGLALSRGGRAARGLVAIPLGLLLLALVFGDRLWVHHYAALPVVAAGAVALLLGLLWRWRAGRAAGVVLAGLLVAANLASWRVVAAELDRTGGYGAISDALLRFADEAAAGPRPPFVAVADWSVMVPVLMQSRGRVPLAARVDTAALRARLCAGQDVAIAWLAPRGEADLPGWRDALAWGEPSRAAWPARDGTPVLFIASWRGAAAAERAARGCP